MAVIKPIRYSDVLEAPNAQELLRAYAEECSIPEIGEAHAQAGQYALLEASGLMSTFGVFIGEELVGFATVLMAVLPHYGQKVATLESIFIAREHRVGGMGRALMLAVELHALSHGCGAILYSAPTESRFAKFLELTPEYRHTNEVYCRSLN